MKKSIIVIGGATACGKSSLAIKLAKRINGEIISADSSQVYKYMDIGTAKPSKEDLKKVKHYLIDEVNPNEEFSVYIFKKRAKMYIEEIYKKGKIPILVGGTGFYINALIYDNNFEKENKKNNTYRNYLYKIKEEKGKEELYKILKEVDYISYKNIHQNNVKRVIRALEYFHNTGKEISKHNLEEKNKKEAYKVNFFILNINREILYEKINDRVDKMIKLGLVDEVKELLNKGFDENLISMQAIGYKEVINYLKGEYSFEYMVELIKRNTRRFSKRQITWFKHQTKGIWINIDKFSKEDTILEKIVSLIVL